MYRENQSILNQAASENDQSGESESRKNLIETLFHDEANRLDFQRETQTVGQHSKYNYFARNDQHEKLIEIKGYDSLEYKQCFHISLIRNSSGDPHNAIYFSKLFGIIEDDLRNKGYRKITMTALKKIAPVAMKRYDFKEGVGDAERESRIAWKIFNRVFVHKVGRMLYKNL